MRDDYDCCTFARDGLLTWYFTIIMNSELRFMPYAFLIMNITKEDKSNLQILVINLQLSAKGITSFKFYIISF